MRNPAVVVTFAAGVIAVSGVIAPAAAQEAPGDVLIPASEIEQSQIVDVVTAGQDDLLARVESGDRVFIRLENSKIGRVSFFHRRRLGEAFVERDFIRYQFETATSRLVEATRHWRDDLPDVLPAVIPAHQAESSVVGAVESSTLYIISPDSDIFRLQPTPENPCWVVTSRDGERVVFTIVDAVNGERLGEGLPPPYAGLSIHGPDHPPNCDNASPLWYTHAQNAHDWFETMGYDSVRIGSPLQSEIEDHIQSDSTAMFYELDHGGSASFKIRCEDDFTSAELATMIEDYASMPFAFMGSCEGMCVTGNGYFEHEFRKGGDADTVVVGYCGMSWEECSDDCWGSAVPWQDVLFDFMNRGFSVGYAFAQANLAFPVCTDQGHNCMRIAGDTGLRFAGGSPTVSRSLCGPISGSLAPVSSLTSTRAHHIRCNSQVPPAMTLAIEADNVSRFNEVAFVNDSTLTVNGSLSIDNGTGQRITLVSSLDRSTGIYVLQDGQIVAGNGGQIRVCD